MKPEGPYLIGVDGGTESLRAGIFDLRGTPLAYASTAYPTRFPHPAWAQQESRDWWKALGSSVRGAAQKSSIQQKEILAMEIDTTCCSVVDPGSKRRASEGLPHMDGYAQRPPD